ncbi:glycosyltransferase family 4 protein [Maribacter polysaccharolyticus]|uniref:glycosyltransferase family 4 protein n=1 Tax=Maribacter polysaccharolyticus TaxID=3020831 RepID=UPI00237FC2B8|nr:glycosyltransferase family 4 protein [Maribacter polysaccharolyticus]MDE3741473.1 glycosyltransferase family 4 protein [Maribacter polysaccharolyticus]
MKVTQITPGRFHHFHLARQMEIHGLLDKVYTGYPKFKLKDEQGIPRDKIDTFPWIQTPYMKRGSFGLDKFEWLNKEWTWLRIQSLDKYVVGRIKEKGVLIAMSSNGLYSGKKMQSIGGKYICDRGSTHVVFQNEILAEEYNRWGFKWKGIDERIIDKEQQEYEQADYIAIASEFVRNSFIDKGVEESKLLKIPYGARLERFSKIGNPVKGKFSVLWVGSISLRKGFMYALDAFNEFKHPNKEFVVIGAMTTEVKLTLDTRQVKNVVFKGNVPNTELINYYNKADVFLLPSIEDGFGMVMAEAMACGCPVIASTNTGSKELITNNKDGFIIPIRNQNAILESFQKLMDTPDLRTEMSENALVKVRSFEGWDTYGNNFRSLIDDIIIKK